MLLQKLVGSMYSVFMEILLWLIPIVGIIVGVFSAETLFFGSVFVGFILGFLIGLLVDVIFFGPVIILMNIRSSLKNIEKG